MNSSFSRDWCDLRQGLGGESSILIGNSISLAFHLVELVLRYKLHTVVVVKQILPINILMALL